MARSAERHHQDLADDLRVRRTAVHRSCCRLQHRVLRTVTHGGVALLSGKPGHPSHPHYCPRLNAEAAGASRALNCTRLALPVYALTRICAVEYIKSVESVF